MHPWHDVNIGDKAPKIVSAIIEVPQGSKTKYELDKPSGLIRVDRILFSSIHYPANYGFIPQTFGADGDPMDILVLSEEGFVPLSIVEAKPIGLMNMTDQGTEDNKIIAVHTHDPDWSPFDSIDQLPSHRLAQLKRFFADYKKMEKKSVNVGTFLGREEAIASIQFGMKEYKANKDHLIHKGTK